MFLKKRNILLFNSSSSTRFVALDLITDPLTLICLNYVSPSLRESAANDN